MSPIEVQRASIAILLAPVVVPLVGIVIILVSRWLRGRRSV